MGNNRKNVIRTIIYTILSLLQIIVLVFSLMIYTSLNKNLPWYESCGMQFIVIPMIVVPVLLVIGVALKFLSKKYSISSLNVKLPFWAAVLTLIPIIIDGSLNRTLIAIGAWMCVFLIITTIYVIAIHFKNIKNKRETVL